MNCRTANRLISAYLDSELTGHEMLTVRDHLSSCPNCQAELEGLKELKVMLRSAKAVTPNPELQAKIRRAVTAPAWSRKQRQRAIAILAMTGCASALLAALVIAQTDSNSTDHRVIPVMGSQSERISTPIADGTGYVPLYPAKY